MPALSSMDDGIVRLRVQISRLLALATEAQGKGDAGYAEQLLTRAMKLAKEADAMEASQRNDNEPDRE